MKDKTNVLNTYTDYAWIAACLIGGRVCNPRQQHVVDIFIDIIGCGSAIQASLIAFALHDDSARPC